ncbi:hypothetical protein LOC67_07245 [Stieleria sp. JC731]|uniref:hypothetical protein n=1 Tax=Pirellulaceae TaxID=2691357 RepID=UPI001E3B103E|nr:hypothetical protein [Stieleria sp. JC731]MCC9600352.1 hypothetical protein [Stieleria sp. JC731]
MSWVSVNMRNYLFALLTLVLCAYGYDEASRRLLTIPDIEVVKPKPPTNDAELRAELADLFPADAWEMGDCKRLITGRGTLLFQNWYQMSEDQWKLEPLTIVIGRGLADDDAAAPIVLKAPKGAEVQFSKGLDLTQSGSAPPIKMGRMIGDVDIRRAGAVEENQSLHVKTRDVRIDKEKVWTTEKIEMRLGSAIMRGADLTIHLAVSATAATSSSTPSTLLDQMNLVYLDEFIIPLREDEKAKSSLEKKDQSYGGIVKVTCDNRVSYDFSVDSLSLYDNVAITRSVDGKVVDWFNCDWLKLSLRDPTNQEKVRQGPLDWIDNLQASGHPANVNLGSMQFTLNAEKISFDSVKGILNAESSEGVRLIRETIDARLRNLTYIYDPQSPKNIGVINVAGSGKVLIDDPELKIKQFAWNESFKLEPASPANIDEIREASSESRFDLQVLGKVRAKLADNGIATAEQVTGQLKAIPQPNQDGDDSSDKPKLTFLPEVIHATDGVSIDTSQIAVLTDQLFLYFERAADFGRLVAKSDGKTSEPNTSSLAVVTQPTFSTPSIPQADGQAPAFIESSGPLGSLVGFPSKPAAETTNLRQPVARQRPQVSGETISAQLLITDRGLEPRDVSINGAVHVKHQIPSGDELLPVEMLGQTMRLIQGAVSQSSGRDILQLGSGPGRPAQLIMEDGYFIGPTIKVWPSENRVEVDGAGQLKVPTSVLASKSDTAEDQSGDALSKIRWTANPVCNWGKALVFDGVQAILDGGVQIEGSMVNANEPWRQRMTGDQMMIALSSPVELMKKETFAAAELRQISLYESQKEAVVVRAEQRDAYDQMKAIHVLTSRQLNFLPANGGQLVGYGPGWYRGWMMSDSKSSILSPQATKSEHLGNQVLQGVHLTYRESLQCDLKSESAAFMGGVRAGVRKVDAWDEVVDVNQMSRLAVGEMTLDCDRLAFGVSPGYPKDLRKVPGAKTPWELVADGGAVARSNTEARGLWELIANRASYQSLKSWLIVEGSASRSAIINQTLPDGRQGLRMNSPRLALNTKTYEAQAVIKDAQMSNLPLPERGK